MKAAISMFRVLVKNAVHPQTLGAVVGAATGLIALAALKAFGG